MGRDGRPRPSTAMIVDNGRVTWVGPAAQLKPPAGAETVDLTGKFVMPGIINLHGHIGNTVDLQQDAKFYTRESIQKNLATYASYGVTTVVSMGTDQDLIFKIRAEQRAGRPAVTRVYTAGQGMIFKGGYGGLVGVTPGVSTVAEAEAAVEAQAKKGVDIIKLWLDDHLGEQKKMPYDIAKAIIDGAHKRNLPVAAHIFYLEDAKQLVDYGVNGLAHSVRDKSVDASLIAAMKKHGTWQMAPTLTREASMFIYASTPEFVNDPFFVRGVSPAVIQTLKSAQYQKSITCRPALRQISQFLRDREEKSEGAGRCGRPIRLRHRHRASRPFSRLLRTVGAGTHDAGRPDAHAGHRRGYWERGAVPGREGTWDARSGQVGRSDRARSQPTPGHQEHTSDSRRVYRRQSGSLSACRRGN